MSATVELRNLIVICDVKSNGVKTASHLSQTPNISRQIVNEKRWTKMNLRRPRRVNYSLGRRLEITFPEETLERNGIGAMKQCEYKVGG